MMKSNSNVKRFPLKQTSLYTSPVGEWRRTIHPSSSAYTRSGRVGNSSSRLSQTSFFPAKSASSDWGIPRRSQASVQI